MCSTVPACAVLTEWEIRIVSKWSLTMMDLLLSAKRQRYFAPFMPPEVLNFKPAHLQGWKQRVVVDGTASSWSKKRTSGCQRTSGCLELWPPKSVQVDADEWFEGKCSENSAVLLSCKGRSREQDQVRIALNGVKIKREDHVHYLGVVINSMQPDQGTAC